MVEAEVHNSGELSRGGIDGHSPDTVYRTPACPAPAQNCQVDFTIFVACYNEEENIIVSLEEVVKAMTELNRSWEIIVVDDASRDNSASLVRQYMSAHPEYPLVLMVRQENQGLAQNYIEGAFLGNGRYYKLVCGDNVEDCRHIVSVLKHAGEAEMILPYHENVIHARSRFRRLTSYLFTQLVNVASGYNFKYYNGCGVHLRYNVMRWNSNSLGFDFQADLVIRLLDKGKSYKVIPVVGKDRQMGASSAVTLRNLLSLIHFFTELVMLRACKAFVNKKRARE